MLKMLSKWRREIKVKTIKQKRATRINIMLLRINVGKNLNAHWYQKVD